MYSLMPKLRLCNFGYFRPPRGNDTEENDLDLLVDPTPETTLMGIVRIQNRPSLLSGMPVDVLPLLQ